MEVLEKSPGVMVNSDGVISLRGKQGVIVMVDGKPTYLSPTDLANLLKNMPASALDQIEIMTNPSSKYDASGNSGIINIKTKKGKNAGFNGSLMVGQPPVFTNWMITCISCPNRKTVSISTCAGTRSIFLVITIPIISGAEIQLGHQQQTD